MRFVLTNNISALFLSLGFVTLTRFVDVSGLFSIDKHVLFSKIPFVVKAKLCGLQFGGYQITIFTP